MTHRTFHQTAGQLVGWLALFRIERADAIQRRLCVEQQQQLAALPIRQAQLVQAYEQRRRQ